MAGHRLKSSFTDNSSGKLDRDMWIATHDGMKMTREYDYDDGWSEKQTWNGRLPKHLRWTVLVYQDDNPTSTLGIGCDEFKTTARAQAWAMANHSAPAQAA